MNPSTHSGKSPENPLSPSELNLLARDLLENQISRVWVSGEVTDYYMAPSGHSYFGLKDTSSSIKCTLFKPFNLSRQRYSNGDQLLVMGLATLYQDRGNFQIKVERVQKSGRGSLALEFEKLKVKLESLGYFDPKHKKALPQIIQDLAIVTSKSSAAIRDVLNVIRRRNPLLDVKVYNTSVQGDPAVGEIIDALHAADIGQHDAILLTRGGGSEEDLWTFNDISIAQTLFNLNTPCVSAVGHEKDVSISDLVADESAITPSAAAERLTPDLSNLRQRLAHQEAMLWRSMQEKMERLGQGLDLRYSHLQKSHPRFQWSQKAAELQHLNIRLQACLKENLQSSHHQLHQCKSALRSINVGLETKQNHMQSLTERMKYLIHNQLTQSNNHLQKQAAQLHALSPLSTLSRGYSITKDSNNAVLEDINKVKVGEQITTQLKNGELKSVITEINDD